MCYSGKLAMKREALVEASKVARSLKSLEEIDGTINYVLLNYIYYIFRSIPVHFPAAYKA